MTGTDAFFISLVVVVVVWFVAVMGYGWSIRHAYRVDGYDTLIGVVRRWWDRKRTDGTVRKWVGKR